MGWSGGTDLYSEVIRILKKEVPDILTRKAIHLKLIPAFQDRDWDNVDELYGYGDDAFDLAAEELFPSLGADDD